MTLQEKIDKRVGLITQARALLDLADKETRQLSKEEEAQYDKMLEDADALEAEVDRESRLKKLEGALEQRTTTKIPFQNPEGRGKKKPFNDAEEYRSAYDNMVRRSYGMLNQEEVRALSVGVDADGGFLVPTEYERSLIDALQDINVMRGLCRNLTLSTDKSFPMVDSHGSATWVDETGTYGESDDKFKGFTVSAHKEGTVIKVSEELLKDSFIDLASYISTEFARRFAVLEETGFISGNGVKKPLGVMTSAGLGFKTTASSTVVSGDDLIDLQHSLKVQYRPKATWLMTDTTMKSIRKLKNAVNGDYIWQPGLIKGAPNTIFTNPVVIAGTGNMDELGASNKPILYGDFNYYWIIDRQGFFMQRLVELYALNGQVGFKGYKRVDGQCSMPEAFKYLQMKA